MSDATPNRFGSINGGADKDALFLKVYAGEVLAQFLKSKVFMDRLRVRSIANGKSAQFVVSGRGTAEYHTPGTEILGDTVNYAERVINIDDLLVAPRFLASIDEAKTHYDVRSEHSKDAGEALALQMDSHLAQVIALAARETATVTGGNGGTKVVSATFASDVTGAAAIKAIKDAAVALDQKDVPAEDRFCALDPATYANIVMSGDKSLSTDWNPEGNGSMASGKIYRIMGVQLVKTNRLPTTNIATGPTAYQGDFTTTKSLVWHRQAAGTVKLIELGVEMAYDIRRQGTLIVAKLAVGHGILRPECAVEIATA